MVYIGKVVAYQERLSRLSGDLTPLICANEGCGSHIHQVLTVPGEQIGKPGKFYRVVRCLNCSFWGPCYAYFNATGEPVRVEGEFEDHGFLADGILGEHPASLQWTAGAPNPNYDGTQTVAGGEPDWDQQAVTVVCPVCDRPMEFILQLSSMTLDGYRDENSKCVEWRWPRDIGYDFRMIIENYSTLYFFACDKCNVTASLTQCT